MQKILQLSNVLKIAQQFPNVIKQEDIEHLKDEDFKLQAFKNELLQQDPYAFWNSISKLEDPISGNLRYCMLSKSLTHSTSW